jgi:outer membrane protein assembly factor BamB
MTGEQRRPLLPLAVFLVLVLAVVAVGLPAAAATDSAAVAGTVDLPGNGTGDDPYRVSNASDLRELGDDPDANYTLVADIDAANTSAWNDGNGLAPIGNASTPFTGTLDGANHTITNLTINRSGTNNVGLFGVVGANGTVADVELANATVDGNDNTGVVAGRNAGTITGVRANGTVDGYRYIGGLVGDNSGDIVRSDASGTVDGYQYIGGLVGDNSGDIVRSDASGTVSGGTRIGGLVGQNAFGNITTSYATGNVSGNEWIGGLVGLNGGAGRIEKSYSTANASGDISVGGLVGWHLGDGLYGSSRSYINESYATGNVTASFGTVGGLIGENEGLVFDSYWNVQSTNQLITEARLGDRPAGLLTHELTGDEAARNLAGFDFDDTWTVGNTTGSYPSLVANPQRPEPRTNVTTDNLYAGGNGTAADPYRIATWHHLDNVRKNLDANFTLVADLNETTAGYDAVAGPNATRGIGFYPIGDTATPFVGTFDGDGHRIVGLTINASTKRSVGLYEHVGLFGRIGPDGTVRNVSLTAPYVTSSFGTVGGLVGHNGGTISNVSVRATVEDGGYVPFDTPDLRSMGGLAGTNNGTIEHVSVRAAVLGGRSVGGLVGATTDGSRIVNATVTGDAIGDDTVGGLVGQQTGTSGTTRLARSAANVTVDGNRRVGGLVGRQSGAAVVTESYARGRVFGSRAVGGLVGENVAGATVNASYATGNVSGYGPVGGLVGVHHGANATVANAYAIGTVSGDADVGGLVGERLENASVVDAYWDMSTTNRTHSAGGTGVISVELTGSGAPTNATGLDFETTWTVGGTEGAYPVLAANPQSPPPTADTTPLARYRFVAGNVTIPANVSSGDPIAVTVDVRNVGVAAANRTVAFAVDGATVSERRVPLDPDETAPVTVAYDVAPDTNRSAYRIAISTDLETDVRTVDVSDVNALSGTVTNRSGSPVEGATVTAVGFDESATTGPDGEYRLGLPSAVDAVDLRVTRADPNKLPIDTNTTVQLSGDTRQDVTVPADRQYEWRVPDVYRASVVRNDTLYVATETGLAAVDLDTGTERWVFEVEGVDRKKLPTGLARSNGTLYVTMSGAVYDSVHALNATTGAELWNVTRGQRYSAPVVANGTVHLGVKNNGAYQIALNATTGERLWRTRTALNVFERPVVVDGTVYVTAAAAFASPNVYALDARTGGERWNVSKDTFVKTVPAVTDDTLYFHTDGTVYALNATSGRQRWNGSAGDLDVYRIVSVTSERAYVEGRTPQGRTGVAALNATSGSLAWNRTVRFGAVSDGDSVYVDNATGVQAIDGTTGTVRWAVNASPTARPLAVRNGTVYVANGGPDVTIGEPSLSAVDAATGSVRWRFDLAGWTPEDIVAVQDGTVYVQSSGDLYALDPSDLGGSFPSLNESGPMETATVTVDQTVAVGERRSPARTVTVTESSLVSNVTFDDGVIGVVTVTEFAAPTPTVVDAAGSSVADARGIDQSRVSVVDVVDVTPTLRSGSRGPATLNVTVNDSLAGDGSELVLVHRTDEGWAPVATSEQGLGDGDVQLRATLDSFSLVAVASVESADSDGGSDGGTDGGDTGGSDGGTDGGSDGGTDGGDTGGSDGGDSDGSTDDGGTAEPATFDVSVSADGEPIQGEQVTVTGVVANDGGQNGTIEAVWSVDGQGVRSDELTLAPGETATLTFNRTFETAGEHTVSLSDRGAVTVSVQPPQTTTPAPTTTTSPPTTTSTAGPTTSTTRPPTTSAPTTGGPAQTTSERAPTTQGPTAPPATTSPPSAPSSTAPETATSTSSSGGSPGMTIPTALLVLVSTVLLAYRRRSREGPR